MAIYASALDFLRIQPKPANPNPNRARLVGSGTLDNSGGEKEKVLLQRVGFQPMKPLLPVCRRSGDGYRGHSEPLSPALLARRQKATTR